MPTPTERPTRPTSSQRAPLLGLLAVGAWLPVSWLVLRYGDASYAAAADVVLGLALLGVTALQLAAYPSPPVLRTLTVGIGLLLVIAPVVVRAGDQGRNAAAYVNTMACGLLVVGLAVLAFRRTPSEH